MCLRGSYGRLGVSVVFRDIGGVSGTFYGHFKEPHGVLGGKPRDLREILGVPYAFWEGPGVFKGALVCLRVPYGV